MSHLNLLLTISLFHLIINSSIGINQKPDRPNIVFILADDLGWVDLPVYGNTFNEAPNIDRLASEGMRFTSAYAAAPVCSPTRASIQSGQYPARIGINDYIPGHWRPFEEVIVPVNKTQQLQPEIETIAESLKKAGYSTGYFGKWHLGKTEAARPENQGYESVHIYNGGGFYAPRFQPEPQKEYKSRLSEILTEMGIDFMEEFHPEKTNKPFFLFLAHYDVHVQLDADKELIQKYLDKPCPDFYPGNAVYAAMIEHVDKSVGRIVKKLKEMGLSDNTVVVFFSDNGGLIDRYDQKPLIAEGSLTYYENSPLQYLATSNAPLKSGKGSVHEGGIREPLIVKWPGKIKSGAVCDAVVSSVDFYPTFLEIAGVKKKDDQILDGKSIVPELMGNEPKTERAAFWHYPVYHHGEPMGAVRKGDWKLTENFVTGRIKLHNLRIDISENMDMSAIYTEKTRELYNLLKNWQKDVNAEFPVPNQDFNEKRRFEWGRHPSRM